MANLNHQIRGSLLVARRCHQPVDGSRRRPESPASAALFAATDADKRPQDQHMDGTGLRFKTLDHGGEYPDTMPQAIKLTDAQGRSCIYVPITQNGKVVNSQGFVFDPEDE